MGITIRLYRHHRGLVEVDNNIRGVLKTSKQKGKKEKKNDKIRG